jgi:hypothetical protein
LKYTPFSKIREEGILGTGIHRISRERREEYLRLAVRRGVKIYFFKEGFTSVFGCGTHGSSVKMMHKSNKYKPAPSQEKTPASSIVFTDTLGSGGFA